MRLTASQLRRIIREEAGSFDEYERGFQARAAERHWTELSRMYPKAARQVGRLAFETRFAEAQAGAAGGGGSADPKLVFWELVEDSL